MIVLEGWVGLWSVVDSVDRLSASRTSISSHWYSVVYSNRSASTIIASNPICGRHRRGRGRGSCSGHLNYHNQDSRFHHCFL